MEDFSVVIPTLNEEENIGRVIEGVREHGDPDITVVDDGSTDHTTEIAREKGARVIERGGRRDLSRSIVLGLEEACFDKVVIIDGDGQHPPERVPEILEGLDESELFVVSRTGVEGRWGRLRRFMSLGADTLAKTMFQSCRQVRDPVSGFFGVRKGSLDTGRLDPTGYKVLVEILVTHDIEVGETGYVFRQREGGTSSIGLLEVAKFALHLAVLEYREIKNDQGQKRR